MIIVVVMMIENKTILKPNFYSKTQRTPNQKHVFFYRRKQAQQQKQRELLSIFYVRAFILFYDACKYKCIEISKKTEIFISLTTKKITKKGSRSLRRETIFERIQDNFFFSSLQRQIELIFSLP